MFSGKEINKTTQSTKEPIVMQKATNRIVKILDSNYHKADLRQVVPKATHLSDSKRGKLYNLLLHYKDLFDGTLGKLRTEPVELGFKDDAKLHNQRYYPMPHIYQNAFKKELDRLKEIGVLEKVQESEWGLLTFIIPKKDQVQFISDFRQLNAKIKRKPYPLPCIRSDTLQNLEGFQFCHSIGFKFGILSYSLIQ